MGSLPVPLLFGERPADVPLPVYPVCLFPGPRLAPPLAGREKGVHRDVDWVPPFPCGDPGVHLFRNCVRPCCQGDHLPHRVLPLPPGHLYQGDAGHLVVLGLYRQGRDGVVAALDVVRVSAHVCLQLADCRFFIYSILLWYFDAIVSAQGKNVPFYFFLQPSYWGFHCFKEENPDFEPSQRELDELGTFGAADVDDPNVLSEIDDAKNGTGAFAHGDGGLRIYGIHKAFVSRDMFCLRKNVFVANREVVVAVEPNSCLALLGHNGAGKSTLFNQLTGLLKPTHGDALVLGKSIKCQMDEIRSLIGVCPQHDILWDELTAREHVRLYAQLKDLDPAVIEDEVETRLADVVRPCLYGRPELRL